MRLVYQEDERQDCPVYTNLDYKDHFYVNINDDWKSLILPNDTEVNEYGNGQPLRGLIAMCLPLCSWGQCPKGSLDRKALDEGKIEFEINGLAVSKLHEFEECEILRHSDGYQWQPNSDGRFDIRARVNQTAEPGSYLRVSSLILW